MNLPTELRRTYHLADVDPAHPIRRAADELERLGAERDALREERDALRALLAEAMPELLGELWHESRICSVCFGHNRHSDVCLVARIDDALRSDR